MSKKKLDKAETGEQAPSTDENLQAKQKKQGPQEAVETAGAAETKVSADDAKASAEMSPEDRIIRLEAEKQGLNEALLRKQADFENYRRRMQKDKEEAIRFANRSLIVELLEVLDNFERALVSHRDEKDSGPGMKSLFEGLELVERQLVGMLSGNWGLKAIDSVGQEFDPNMHEALAMEESGDYEVPTVVENFQTGYILHERVLRPARVKVRGPAS
ncbi:nucleotide exchange factor GrpE [Candidatus Haliotispira prima]|uniref:Protein GrpE n=1 Tax=Candidatus Haliotispira prima TaxID=3034016 RepID=A0ABY8MH23_9SPIO|nr:nucleotide exchange factor GrpE [Candidatus Haliotispira prima]